LRRFFYPQNVWPAGCFFPGIANKFSPKEGKTMKSTWNKLTMAAAALTIAAGVAGAQTYRVEIPFAFQAGGKVMSPGAYRVQIASSQHRILKLANWDAHEAALGMANGLTYNGTASATEAPVLTFECGIGRCALARFWTGSNEPALTFHHRDLGSDTRASLREIRMVKVNGD